ncbi:MAG: ATP-binding cassette domain-containing protein [Oscillospiraceae bacterium]|nr:ATP-binding cassette domain-containing protein [Oscillospiraceae bacterium]
MKRELLHLQEVSKIYHSHEVFRHLSFDVFAGEAVGILIPPLSGKTTLTRILRGDEDYSGAIFFGGKLVNGSLKPYNASRELLCLSEVSPLVPNLTIGENVFLMPDKHFFRPINRRRDDESAQAYLNELGVQISAGELVRNTDLFTRHMVQIAQAVQLGVRLVVFDDPAAYYDPKQLEDVQGVLRLLHEKGIAVLWLAASAFPFDPALLDRVIRIDDYRKTRTVFHPAQMTARRSTEPPLPAAPQSGQPASPAGSREVPALRMDGVQGPGLPRIDLRLERGTAIGVSAPRTHTLQRFGDLFLPGQNVELRGSFSVGGKDRPGADLYADFGSRYVVLTDSFAHDQLLEEQSILDNVYLPVARSRRLRMLSFGVGFQRALRQEISERLALAPAALDAPAAELDLHAAQELVLFRIELQRPAFVVYASSYSQVDNRLQELLDAYFRRYLQGGSGLLIAAPGLDRFQPLLSERIDLSRR